MYIILKRYIKKYYFYLKKYHLYILYNKGYYIFIFAFISNNNSLISPKD